MTDIKVLCVEHHPEYMGMLKFMLESAGYEVMSATTGEQALNLIRTHSVLGVLLEYDLPDAAGIAVRAEMKRIRPTVPVLLFNGIDNQTPFLLRFLDRYVRNTELPEGDFGDLDLNKDS
jgi:two-component system, OmpR family, alkaline phosphatase synthesis response regulator PhoP